MRYKKFKGDVLAKRIKLAREELGLTQVQLAEKVGQERTKIARWETDATTPRADQLFDVAEVLWCSMDWLMGRR